jgi:hypothetical protein
VAHNNLDRVSIPLLLALLVATPAGAEIYKHVDANGTVVYTNRSETVPAARRWDPAAVQLGAGSSWQGVPMRGSRAGPRASRTMRTGRASGSSATAV